MILWALACIYMQSKKQNINSPLDIFFVLVLLLVLLVLLSELDEKENFFVILFSRGPILSSSRDVHVYIYLSICPLPLQFFSRPFIGPQIT